MNILILEDKKEIRVMNEEILSSKSRTIKAAATVEESFNLIINSNFDLIVSDFDLIKETCKDLIERLQKSEIILPFIMYSGSNNIESKIPTDYFVTSVGKPDFQTLKRVVDEFEEELNAGSCLSVKQA